MSLRVRQLWAHLVVRECRHEYRLSRRVGMATVGWISPVSHKQIQAGSIPKFSTDRFAPAMNRRVCAAFYLQAGCGTDRHHSCVRHLRGRRAVGCVRSVSAYVRVKRRACVPTLALLLGCSHTLPAVRAGCSSGMSRAKHPAWRKQTGWPLKPVQSKAS
jgi:hypothetical protein